VVELGYKFRRTVAFHFQPQFTFAPLWEASKFCGGVQLIIGETHYLPILVEVDFLQGPNQVVFIKVPGFFLEGIV
jgi:hypothetical protein